MQNIEVFLERDIPDSTGVSLFLLYTLNMVIYLDSVFMVQLLLNIFLFGLLRRTAETKTGIRRYGLGIFCYSLLQMPRQVFVQVYGNHWWWLCYDLLILQVAIYLCFQPRNKMIWARRNIQLGICTLLLGGLLFAIEERLGCSFSNMIKEKPMKFFFVYCLGVMATKFFMECFLGWKKEKIHIRPLSIEILHKVYEVNSYWDSGNGLVHPLTGVPVIIGEYAFFRGDLPPIYQKLLDDFFLYENLDYERMLDNEIMELQVINCLSVGGLSKLPILPVRYCENKNNSKEQRNEVYMALSNRPICADGSYQILLHRDL